MKYSIKKIRSKFKKIKEKQIGFNFNGDLYLVNKAKLRNFFNILADGEFDILSINEYTSDKSKYYIGGKFRNGIELFSFQYLRYNKALEITYKTKNGIGGTAIFNAEGNNEPFKLIDLQPLKSRYNSLM